MGVLYNLKSRVVFSKLDESVIKEVQNDEVLPVICTSSEKTPHFLVTQDFFSSTMALVERCYELQSIVNANSDILYPDSQECRNHDKAIENLKLLLDNHQKYMSDKEVKANN